MVELLNRTKVVPNSIKGDYVPVVRNSLNWGSHLYNEIRKGVSIYYNYRKEDMYSHHIELEDLIQSVAITLYRWRNFDPKKYPDKKLIEYINPIANQKAIKLKRRFYKTRQQSVVFLDDVQYGNTSHNDSNEVALIDSIQDSRYRYLDFMEECLSRIPEDHVFYVDDVRFNTKEIFRLLFSNYSGEEISDAAGVDGKRFRKVKRQLVKQFFSNDADYIYSQLPSNVEFKADYFKSRTKEESLKEENDYNTYRESLSGKVVITKI